jgi:hypothetical protein
MPVLTPQQQELLDAQKELLASSFNQAMAYTNVILGAGYAGFFATWAFTRDKLSPRETLWSAFLLTVSLLSFVLFEVYRSFYTSRQLLGLSRAVNDPANIAQRLLEWQRERHSVEIRFGRIWATTFWITLLTDRCCSREPPRLLQLLIFLSEAFNLFLHFHVLRSGELSRQFV